MDKTMDDLLLHGLKDIYYAENQIVKALPTLIDKQPPKRRLVSTQR
jgi:ferritin-like metal-binding protein YciE